MTKILIIEDDQMVANIYRNKFSVEHFQVETALDGEAGVESLHQFQPDVVILDLMLPKMSGLEVLTKIRSQDHLKQLPVIVLSNTYLSNMVQQAWKAGATKCLSKATCTPKQVIDVVRGLGTVNGASAAGQPRANGHAAKTTNGAKSDAALQTDLRNSFLAGLPAALAASRSQLQAAVKSANAT